MPALLHTLGGGLSRGGAHCASDGVCTGRDNAVSAAGRAAVRVRRADARGSHRHGGDHPKAQ